MVQVKARVRVALYARVSTEEQGSEEHFSIEAQLNEMRELAQAKGWEVVAEFVESISGTRRDRPQLQALLALAAQRGFDILLVHELSRLSRSVYHTLDIFDVLGRYNIGFASVKDPDFDFADPTKRFFLVILAAINEYYINLLGLHTSKSKRQRAKDGLYNASITPYGYALSGDPKKPPVLVEKEVAAVRLAFEKYATGQFSHQDIASLLNSEGHRTRAGRGFSKDTVAEMLLNPFYMGVVAYKVNHGKAEETFPGMHEPIISAELWERCQSVRASRHSASRAAQRPYRVYLLSNVARCDVCGRKLRSQFTNSHQYYREMSYERGYCDCPHQSIGIRTDPVDQQIHAIVSAIQLPADWQQELVERLIDDEEIAQLERRRASLEAEGRRLREMRLRGDFDDDLDMYQSELARIRRDLANLPTYDQLENMSHAAETIQSLREIWGKASPAEKRDLVRLILHEVAVDVPHGRVVALSPYTVFIPILRQMPLLAEREFGVFVPVWTPDHANGVLTIPQLPALTAVPMQGMALPFLAEYPLAPDAEARIAPAFSHALALCKQAGASPEMLIQVASTDRPPLPADVRKWQDTISKVQSFDEVARRQEESVDVLTTQMLLWDNATRADHRRETDALLGQMCNLLTACGVWYMAEVLPAEMPAHWVYTYFPEAWTWARRQTLDLHALYGRLQAQGVASEVKRHVWYQPVRLGTALEIARQRPGLLARLSDPSYQEGIERLERAVMHQGAEHVIGSEVALIEIWAQKGKGAAA